MKRLCLVSIFLFCAIGVKAQCIATANDPCVEVNQSVLDRTAKALTELAASREALAAYAHERGATDAERAAYQNAFKAVDVAVAAFQKGLDDRDKIIALWQKAFDSAMALATHYESQLNKPKSAWSKFLNTLKEIALIATGLAIGTHL